ncbi:MAG: glutamine-hydrolyzing carbamoyl-phosphate synthase small subunit [Gammaproteobacteria bacterium]|nr:glutamine-hydrolyzing carbamoyl-phosphate synthase small subunit [Gammaproteobacteria bacterium]
MKPDLRLLLEDGTEMAGSSFGADTTVAGEVVFNTGMAGYIETLTDPSYCGQILVTTYPLIGNYGVPAPRREATLDGPYESGRIQVQALVVQNYVDHYSHYSATRSLAEWLRAENIPAVTGIDTRTLTRHLRAHGTMRGWLLPADAPVAAAQKGAATVDMEREVFLRVAPHEPVRYDGGDTNILLIDIGAKDNIVRSLLARDASVNRIPWHAELAPHAANADGILIGNGPGDPKDLDVLIGRLGELMKTWRKPIFGICLGNQILTLAAGGDTYKLPYGHRSCNQPVQDRRTGRCYVTSQNHGYAVRDDTLPDGWEPWFVNVNDETNEGIRCTDRPFYSVQFHPEAHPGPTDTGFLFDDFLQQVRELKNT